MRLKKKFALSKGMTGHHHLSILRRLSSVSIHIDCQPWGEGLYLLLLFLQTEREIAVKGREVVTKDKGKSNWQAALEKGSKLTFT